MYSTPQVVPQNSRLRNEELESLGRPSRMCEPCSTIDVDELGGERLLGLLPREMFLSVVALRRKLHAFPELAFQEHTTAKTLRDELSQIDGVELLDFSAGGTGVLALIEGAIGGGPTVLFRADMDALPIAEDPIDSGGGLERDEKRQKVACCALCGSSPWNAGPSSAGGSTLRRQVQKPVVSTVAGVSHACGHDGHMAMLVGAAKLLGTRRGQLQGRIVLLFQPAEERHPLSNPQGGAIHMIRDQQAGRKLALRLGALDTAGVKATAEAAAAAEADSDDARAPMDGNDTSMDSPLLMGVDEVYGCHLWNYSSAGTVGIAAGAVTANSDSCVSWTRTADPLVARAPRMPPAVAPRTESSVLPSRAESFCLGRVAGFNLWCTVRAGTPPRRRAQSMLLWSQASSIRMVAAYWNGLRLCGLTSLYGPVP